MSDQQSDSKYGHLAFPENEKSKAFMDTMKPLLRMSNDLFKKPQELRAMVEKYPFALSECTPAAYGLIYRNIKVDQNMEIPLKIYIPNTPVSERPIVLMLHGGGMLCSSRSAQQI
jgi:acetyl esterase/lipase